MAFPGIRRRCVVVEVSIDFDTEICKADSIEVSWDARYYSMVLKSICQQELCLGWRGTPLEAALSLSRSHLVAAAEADHALQR